MRYIHPLIFDFLCFFWLSPHYTYSEKDIAYLCLLLRCWVSLSYAATFLPPEEIIGDKSCHINSVKSVDSWELWIEWREYWEVWRRKEKKKDWVLQQNGLVRRQELLAASMQVRPLLRRDTTTGSPSTWKLKQAGGQAEEPRRSSRGRRRGEGGRLMRRDYHLYRS